MIAVLLPMQLAASEVLFPEPLHLTREVTDPISGTTVQLEEYCYASRVISIRDGKTSIADYEKGELTEIDRTKGTFSVTSFDALARALADQGPVSAKKSDRRRDPELTDLGVRAVGNRGGRAFEARIDNPGASQKIEVVVDQQMKLSRAAVEVLVGAAFPLRRTQENEIVLAVSGRDRAAARVGSGSAVRDHALPLEQVTTWNLEGETLRVTNRIIRIGNELPPPELIAIPPGAAEVESEIVLRSKMLEELDRLPSDPSPLKP
jgi:hypothetical protein